MRAKKKTYTVCCQSGRILLLVPTSFVVFVVAIATFILEFATGNGNYKIGWQTLCLAVGLFLLMVPGIVVSALCGKKLCQVDDKGIYYKDALIPWTSIESIEYAYGYTRYNGDHTYLRITAGNKETRLPRGPIWFPLLARKYTSEFTMAFPHFKKHFLKGGIIGLALSAIISCVYFL